MTDLQHDIVAAFRDGGGPQAIADRFAASLPDVHYALRVALRGVVDASEAGTPGPSRRSARSEAVAEQAEARANGVHVTISIELAIIGALGTIVSVVLTLMGAARQRRKDRDEQHEATDRKIAELRQEMAAQAIAAAEARGSLSTWRSGVDDQLAGRREQHDVLRTENARQHTEILATAVDPHRKGAAERQR